MRLLALSDLHVGHAPNREALAALPAHPEDWLILAGDLGETVDHLAGVFETLGPRFARLLWVPGNHELYRTSRDPCQRVGEDRYHHLVALARAYGVLTPEDPWALWPGDGPPTRVALCFVGYDYSFAPEGMDPAAARRWAAEAGIHATDERLIDPHPYPDMVAWCHARVRETERRLATEPRPGERLVLVNHWPLRRDLVRLDRVPLVARFTPWCGTRLTEDWHRCFPVSVVVTGHLHMRATDWRDGVRFEEVALGYPRHWRQERGAAAYLRQILPRVPPPGPGDHGPVWHR